MERHVRDLMMEIPMFGDDRMRILAQMMDVAALRAQVHAANLANQNTPGYKAKAVAFEDAFRAALEAGGPDEAAEVSPEVIEPRDTPVQADGNDVSIDREIIDAAKNQTLYDAYIAMARGKLRLINVAASSAPGG
jgi:flagellar basal-body rod protein FlgB